jgi:hypothetical protein
VGITLDQYERYALIVLRYILGKKACAAGGLVIAKRIPTPL